jgi:hypothetical protein
MLSQKTEAFRARVGFEDIFRDPENILFGLKQTLHIRADGLLLDAVDRSSGLTDLVADQSVDI